jgi:hypothetical protein
MVLIYIRLSFYVEYVGITDFIVPMMLPKYNYTDKPDIGNFKIK